MRIAQLSTGFFALLAGAVNPALATQAIAPRTDLTLPAFYACQVTDTAPHNPIGLLRFSATDPAIGFATTTEAGLLLTDNPAFTTHLARKGTDGAGQLWLLREEIGAGISIPFDAELRFQTAEGKDRVVTREADLQLTIFSMDIAGLLAAFPRQDRLDYVITAKGTDDAGRARILTQGSIDLDRLRMLRATVGGLFDGMETGRLACETPVGALPDVLNPTRYRDCILHDYPNRRTSGRATDNFVRIAWEYRMGGEQRFPARINIELTGPALRVASIVPDPPLGQTDIMVSQLKVTLTGLESFRSGANVDASVEPTLRIDGDWGSTEMPLGKAAMPWPSDLTAQMLVTRSAVRLTVLAPDGSKLQGLTVPVGSFRNARRDIRSAAQELSRQVADPMAHCIPPLPIVFYHQRIERPSFRLNMGGLE